MHSHHSHSGQFCTHAKGQLEECIQEAIRQKFTIFCLTEHIPRYRESDIYPGEKTDLMKLMDTFIAYHSEARRLQIKYAEEITIFVGLETEYIRPIDLRILELLVHRFPVDFMVGSVHHVNSIPIDFDKEFWHKALTTCIDEEEFYGRYFDHQFEVIQAFKPLVIGHIDVILLMAPEDADLMIWESVRKKIRRNVEEVVGYGGMFELNSAAFRKGWKTAYPRPNIVRIIQEYGGKFCLSDDSHGPEHIGLNYHLMQQYVKDMGIELSHLASIDGKIAVRTGVTEFQTWVAKDAL